MGKFYIDINADVGEGLNNEMELMPYLSSCNIACGGHAGDLKIMQNVVRLAKTHKVKIGAHPSFPDKDNFGRVEMEMSSEKLFVSLKEQIRNLLTELQSQEVLLYHIKPHGALYNLAAKNKKTARVIIDVVKSFSMPLKIYAPYNSVIAKIAKEENIEVVFEAFADRNYNEDLSLVSREKNDAILTDKNAILKHIFNMIKNKKITTINGVEVSIKASTFCVHGDTENAVEILRFLNTELPKKGIKIK